MNVELQLLGDLRRHEGCRLSVYQDSVGVWTIGYGHTKGITKDTRPITQKQADDWLAEDATKAVLEFKKFYPEWYRLSPVRRTVVFNMSFNLGVPRLRLFRNFLRELQSGEFDRAALSMLDSLWAAQVKGRAVELAKRMSTDKIEQKHLVITY